MSWLKDAADRRASGEEWEAILGRLDTRQIKCSINEAGIAPLSDMTLPTELAIAIPFLDYLSRHRNTDVRRAVARALTHYRYSDVIRTLLRLLTDRRPEVRADAACSLSYLESPNIVPLLERMLHDPDQRVRWVAARALGKEQEYTFPIEWSFPRTVDGDKGSDGAARRRGLPRPARRPSDTEREQDRPSQLPRRVSPEFQRQRSPRHLRGGFCAMYSGNDDDYQEGYIDDYISCLEGYRYQFSVAVSHEEIQGLDKLAEELPTTIDRGAATLAVVLLPDDDDHLTVEDDPPVKLLHLPAEGPSNVVHFTVRGVKPGESSLQVLVYHRGCLVIRAETSPISVRARAGSVEPFASERIGDTVAMTAAVMDHGKDLATIAGNMQMDRFASLLIEEENEHLLFALFYQDDGEYHFSSARVPVESTRVEYETLREKLLEVIELKSGLLGRVFRDDIDLQITPKEGKEALSMLRDAGVLLWYNLFAHPDTEPVRKQLVDLVAKSSEQGIMQIVSDDLFVPWQLMYVDDKQPEPSAELFWGMRFQIEHTLAKGVGLRIWKMDQGEEPMIAFVNQYLPSVTVETHNKVFELREYSEDKLIEEFERRHNRRPAFYFYCHAEFEQGGPDRCWIKLTDDRHKLTLLRLQQTSSDLEGQLEFDCAPLVFLNACESGQVDSRFYQSFVGFLLKYKKAGGVIGTETEMPAFFATDFAKRFWNSVQEESKSVGQVLYELRRQYWEKHNNPLGLLYSLYANAELKAGM